MYGLKYTIPFKTLSNISCEIKLEEKGFSGTSMELTGGATPFTIPTDESDLLTPIRASGATLSVFGSDYLRDLYTSDPQGVRITQYTNGVLHWIGFLTPDTFSQDFSRPEFIYEMECVSALSTLKYKEFDLTDDFVSFREIIEQACVYAGYDVIYLTNSVRTKTGKFYDLEIASANFYDELGEAMTYYEVLEEIAKFFGCTFHPFEDDLYFLDYAAIRGGYNSYTRIAGASVTNVTLSDPKTVTNYKGTGTRLSRIAGKNKATVNCSLYEVENLIPEFNEDGITVYEPFPIQEGEQTINDKTKQKSKGIVRYFHKTAIKFYKYTMPDSSPVESDGAPQFNECQAYSCFVRTAQYDPENPPNRLTIENELQVRNHSQPFAVQVSGGGGRISSLDDIDPVLTITSERGIITNPNLYFCINFQMKHTVDFWKERIEGVEDVHFDSDTTIRVRIKFRVGNHYYNGSGWTTSESTFFINLEEAKKGSKYANTYRQVENTNNFTLGIGDLTGYVFKAPDNVIIGVCELTIFAKTFSIEYSPGHGILFDRNYPYTYVKGLELTYAIRDEQALYNEWVGKDSKNDLIYENVIEGDYIEEADEIDLKICTNPDGKLALSSVLNNGQFLKEIVTDVYGTGQPEKILLQRVVTMFENPRFVIDPALKNDAKPYTVFTEPHLGKQFLVAGGEEDIKMERTRYNLIEL